jgi:hypothetical protein
MSSFEEKCGCPPGFYDFQQGNCSKIAIHQISNYSGKRKSWHHRDSLLISQSEQWICLSNKKIRKIKVRINALSLNRSLKIAAAEVTLWIYWANLLQCAEISQKSPFYSSAVDQRTDTSVFICVVMIMSIKFWPETKASYRKFEECLWHDLHCESNLGILC